MENTNNEKVTSKRDAFLERMRSRYPDRDFTDEEALYGQIADDYDDYDKQISDNKEQNAALTELFARDPRGAAFLMDWRDGGDPVISLVRQFGTDIKDAIDDPARMDEIAAANKDYLERVAKNKELEEAYQSNLATSLSTIDELQKENGLSDEQVDEALGFLMGIVQDGIIGKFTPESIDLAMKAINHDTDVAVAGEEGEIRGRNTKIEERLRKKNSGDSTAQLGSKNNTLGDRGAARSIFDFAKMAR